MERAGLCVLRGWYLGVRSNVSGALDIVVCMTKTVLVNVAWPYANGPRHIGHVAGFGVPSDVFARYHRMRGNNVLMVSGTDEHGTPLLVQADKEGVTVTELADRYNRQIVEDLQGLGLSYDLFTRTTTRNHYAAVQELFRGLYDNGYMVKKTTMGAVSPTTGRTLPDRYIEGTCPICKATDARGDQCDNCGNQLDPVDLINPVSKINGETPQFIETEHFMLDLPALAGALEEWLKGRENWRPNVLKFSLNLLEDIQPRAMTRDIDWGIPIPVEGWEDNGAKKLYVWFDAVVGYLSASIEWAYRSGNPDAWKQWWQNGEAESFYFMGKDNITFHSQIWPAELLGYAGKGDKGGKVHELGELNLPTEVVSSEFLTMSGSKFSSSKGVVIYVKDFLKDFGADALRYFIAVAGPENNDADFTWDEFVRRINNELANGWGNLVNRTVSMAHKNFGEVPQPGELHDADSTLLKLAEDTFGTVAEALEASKFKVGMSAIMHVVAEANAYIAAQEPWVLAKSEDPADRERLATVLWTALQVVSDCNVMLTPYLPHTAQKVHETLGRDGIWAAQPRIEEVVDDMPVDVVGVGVPEKGRHYPVITGDYDDQQAVWQRVDVVPGTALAKPKPLVAKLDPELGETGPEWAPVQ
ncbi:methionyl-tRNA synthetase [Corynebacterium renale]|uniref:Methionine--tRNA ligase n=2 Tax=Corynebacterium renale TaxID=1724 RepID=A0A2A9DM27_9CORY|nr:methionyl-tRNA synthetase [Corynebacterium renale]SQI25219.1 methionyl-tRNA synthetase [Corynebacterium renale]